MLFGCLIRSDVHLFTFGFMTLRSAGPTSSKGGLHADSPGMGFLEGVLLREQGRCTFRLERGKNLALVNHCDACDRMNFHPLGVIRVLHIGPHDANAGSHRRNLHWTVISEGAGYLGVLLSYRELADDLEY